MWEDWLTSLNDFTELKICESCELHVSLRKMKFKTNQSKMSEAFLVRYPWLQKWRVENPEASYEQTNHCEESQHQSGFEDGCTGFLINKSNWVKTNKNLNRIKLEFQKVSLVSFCGGKKNAKCCKCCKFAPDNSYQTKMAHISRRKFLEPTPCNCTNISVVATSRLKLTRRR